MSMFCVGGPLDGEQRYADGLRMEVTHPPDDQGRERHVYRRELLTDRGVGVFLWVSEDLMAQEAFDRFQRFGG